MSSLRRPGVTGLEQIRFHRLAGSRSSLQEGLQVSSNSSALATGGNKKQLHFLYFGIKKTHTHKTKTNKQKTNKNQQTNKKKQTATMKLIIYVIAEYLNTSEPVIRFEVDNNYGL
jgi:hypothetical protein